MHLFILVTLCFTFIFDYPARINAALQALTVSQQQYLCGLKYKFIHGAHSQV